MPRSRTTPKLRSIGAQLRDIRERSGDRQAAVAERAGISVHHYCDVEGGRQPASRVTYLRIADALGLTVEDMDRITGREEVNVS